MPDDPHKALDKAHAILRKLEKKRKSRIFVFFEAGEDHICYPQRSWIFGQKDEFKGIDRLEIFLHSGGGHAEYAYQIAKLFRRRCKILNVIVPIMAKSAATLMCLAADAVYMGERAELGPLDVQITDPVEKGLDFFSPIDEFKSMEFLKEYSLEMLDYYAFALVERGGMSVKEAFHEALPAVASLMGTLYQKIDPSKIGSYRRSLAIGEEYAKRLLQLRSVPNSEKLAENLVWKYPSHDFVIDRAEAKSIGLPVVHLDEAEDDLFFDAVRNFYDYGGSEYAFTKADQAKRKPTKRVPRAKPKAAAIAKTATA